MHYLPKAVLLLLWTFPYGSISVDIEYKDLEEIDAVCDYLDTCNMRRTSDSLDKYTCHCESFCSKYRTCCIDSLYRDVKLPGRRPACRHVTDEYDHYYFMVDTCSSTHNADADMVKLCKEELSEHDNLTPIIPVTSLDTNVTYKNYYCFKCNEDTKNFVYWNVKVNANSDAHDIKKQNVVLTYDMEKKTWMAPVGEIGSTIPVSVFIEIPNKIQDLPKICVPHVISTCSGKWRIQDVKRKCSKYTSFIYISKDDENIRYRNPHCALCNFESLDNMICGMPAISRTTNRTRFSFSILLDINPEDGDQVGKIQRCDEKSTWDPCFKKCRRFICINPGHVVKDGKCGPP